MQINLGHTLQGTPVWVPEVESISTPTPETHQSSEVPELSERNDTALRAYCPRWQPEENPRRRIQHQGLHSGALLVWGRWQRTFSVEF